MESRKDTYESRRQARLRREEARAAAEVNSSRKEEKRKKKIEAQRRAAGVAEPSAPSVRNPPAPRKWPPEPPPPPPPKPRAQYYGRANDLGLLLVTEDSPETIRRAYKRAALRAHPDRNPSPEATQEFQQIQAAYERLMA
jgi:hypothetical protein